MPTSGPGQSPKLLLAVLEELNQRNIPSLVIGALAAATHGAIRASIDADALIYLSAPEQNPIILTRELSVAGFPAVYASPGEDDPIRGMIMVKDAYGNRVDLLLGIRRMRRDAYERGILVPLLDAHIRVVGIEDFIAMKLITGSHKDVADAEIGYQVNRTIVNETLLTTLAEGFGPDALVQLQKLRAEAT